MNSCFIFGALPVKRLTVLPEKGDFVIAADSGLISLKRLSFKPDIIIGDFDSLGYTPSGEVIKLPVRKDKTDVGYAADYALERGFKNFYVYGAFGGKEDHTVANLQICAAVAAAGGRMYLFGEKQTAVAIKDAAVEIMSGGRVSVFAFGGKASGVTIKGFSYELENAELDPLFPLGVSNSLAAKSGEVSVKNGTLLIIYDN